MSKNTVIEENTRTDFDEMAETVKDLTYIDKVAAMSYINGFKDGSRANGTSEKSIKKIKKNATFCDPESYYI